MSLPNGPVAANFTRYERAAHAMQTGVAYMGQYEPKELEPKHLRVGVNSAMVEHGALVKLLIDRGVITLEDWSQELADGMEREAESYRERLTQYLGTNVTLA